MSINRVFFVAIILLSGANLLGQINKLHFDRYNTSNGLSNNRVYTILQDKQGFLWFGTLDGLNRFDGYSFTIYRNIPLDSLSLQSNRIVNMYEDYRGKIWLLTKKNGISCFDPETETFQHYKNIAGANLNLYDIDIDRVFEDDENELFFLSGLDLLKYNRITNTIIFVSSNDSNHYAQPDSRQKITAAINRKYKQEVEIISELEGNNYKWIATRRNGLFLQKKNESELTIEKYNYAPFENVEIKCIYKDQSGIIWIGTKNKGVFKHNPLTRNFQHFTSFGADAPAIEEVTIRAITDDTDGNLWIGTYNNGLVKFNRKNHQFTNYKHVAGKSKSLPNNMVRTLYTDIDGNVWIGTYGGASMYNKATNDFYNYLPINQSEEPANVNDSTHIYFNRVYGFDNDYFGNLWIANWRGISKLNTKTQIFKHYPSSYFGVDNIREIFVDKSNIIWIGSEFGGLVQFNALTEEFVHYLPDHNENTLSHQNVFAIHESKNNKLYVSTFNGLSVLDKISGKFSRYTTNDGLAGNMIYGILEDKSKNIWLTTTNGLSVLNTKTKKIINYSEKIGLQNNEFAEGAYHYCLKTGEMVIGGINGINIFNPETIQDDTIAPKVAITSLQLFNQPVELNHKDHILDKVINYTHEITLKHSNKVISFEFTALHFAMLEENKFKYKLEGFDNDWVNTGANRRYATYTNLKPGKYIFKVIASNHDGYWSKQAAELKITILPPIWLTWWAFVFYVVLATSIMILFRYYSIRSMQMKNALKLERIKREKTEEIHQMKLNFFTNVSHEFRTPLSLILSPLDDIFKLDLSTPLKSCMHQLKLIQSNSLKMLHLTNQVVDLRKIEMGEMELNVVKTALNEFIGSILVQFQELAKYKHISFTSQIPSTPVDIWIDQDKIEKALNNLLSNAIKYSPCETGKIEVGVSLENEFNNQKAIIIGSTPKHEFVLIKVKDNGIGIPQELLGKIFKQFYRINSELNLSMQGSGIGLALVKEMILLHGGAIAVESIENEGSSFYLMIPLGYKHFNPSDLAFNEKLKPPDRALHILPVEDDDIEVSAAKKYQSDKKTILLVEDNEELLKYIAGFLSANYNILKAKDGQEGIEMAFKHMPDIIISDVMMPKKNGIELCKILKNDIKTSHILIILLSAKSTDEDQIEGLNCKADDYVLKPFNKQLLIARINNLLESRELLISSLTNYKKNKMGLQKSLSPIDQEFIEKVNEIVQKNLSNVNLNVEKFSAELGMSRSNLHIKLKALTKQSASDYIRTFRLHYSLQLLREQKKNINEISYDVGFNTPSYFIKCFKEKYGITPKEYLKS